ncbi:MAG: HAMP domain-containing sensor histidine kinase [Pseudomonadota bacterium]|nr:HAMP domain-containing sensor histidine kinase [Pseudomonadota bacterium]
MIRLKGLFNTSTFKLSLLYSVIFSSSVGVLFLFVYINSGIFAEDQMEAAITTEVQGFSETYKRDGILGLVAVINRRVDPNFRTDGVYILTDPDGRRIAGNLSSWPKNVEAQEEWINFSSLDMTRSVSSPSNVRALQLLITPGGYKLLVGRDVSVLNSFRKGLLRSLNIGLGITIALGVLGGILFSKSIMSRVERITLTCKEIMKGDLSQRISGAGQDDELSRLSSSVNEMLDQIERLMNGLREVSDNVAHDLRTPLNRLRTKLELISNRTKQLEEKKYLDEAISHADDLLATFSSLLKIARAEASLKNNFKIINLTEVVNSAIELYLPLAEEEKISLNLKISENQKSWGDPHLLAQAIANLIDNAIKYTSEEGVISISLNASANGIYFSISDTGPGIPKNLHEKVLERLYRVDNSRSSSGSGLGLSLVNAVVKSHNLTLKLENLEPGLKVSIFFPKN